MPPPKFSSIKENFAYILKLTTSVLQSRNLYPPSFTLSLLADYVKKYTPFFNNV